MKATKVLFIAVLIGILFAGLGSAEVSTGSFKFNLFEVEGFTTGIILKFDAAYEQKYSTKIVPYFRVIYPKELLKQTRVLYPPKAGGAYIKISIGTTDNKLVENIQFTSLKIPLTDLEKRMATLKDLFLKKAMPLILKNKSRAKLLDLYPTKINQHPALVCSAGYYDADGTFYLVNSIGILHEEKEAGIWMINHLNPQFSPVKKKADLRTKGWGMRVVSGFKFLE